MIRIGRVVAVDSLRAKVRVEIPDTDGVVSYWLPVLHKKTQLDKYYHLPDIGELVVVVFLDYGVEEGFVLGAIYNDIDLPPEFDRNVAEIKFSDGTTVKYDKNTKKLYIHSVGDIEIVSDTHITLIAPKIDLNP